MAWNNDEWKKIGALINAEVETLENQLTAKATAELAKDLTLEKSKWAQSRLARQGALGSMFKTEIKKSVSTIMERTHDALRNAVKVSAQDIIETTGYDIARQVKTQGAITLRIGEQAIKDRTQSVMAALFTQAVQDYRATITTVQLDSRGLFEALTEAVEKKADDGYTVYADGRKVSFKTYMEMSIRTDLQQNALKNLEETARAVGLEAYVASSHADSADDHDDFQGYYYLADGVPWKPEYSKFNFHPKYRYLTEVKNLGFLTRPNCRHYVLPVRLDDILDGKDLHKELKILNEPSKDGAYDDLKDQRYNERQIRKYKARAENDRIMLEKAPDAESKALAQERLRQSKSKTREWQKRQVALERTSNIKREYIREKPGVVIQNAKPVRPPN